MSIKNELYSVLNDFGKESLQIEFQNNINSSIPKIKEILSKTIEKRNEKTDKKMNNNYNHNNSEKSLSLLCEALLHYLLTTTSLPSQRKIMLKDIEIDLVIPDLKTLNKDPKRGVIIKFDKDASTIKYIEKLQKNISIDRKNIWIVSSIPFDSYSEARNYVIYKNKKHEESHILYTDEKSIENINNKLTSNEHNNYNNNNSSKNIQSNVFPFFTIIVDIDKFLKDIKHTGLKLIT